MQVLNEGIYSDGGYGIDKFGFDASAIELVPGIPREKYGTIEKYNDVCATTFNEFLAKSGGAAVGSPASRAAVRPWIDWAEFGQWFYRQAAETYIGYLRECGVSAAHGDQHQPAGRAARSGP